MDTTRINHNNSGHKFRIAVDIAKEGSHIWDLTPYFKGRVGDNNFGLQVTWYYQGQLMNVVGMKPYIEGLVGQYSFGKNGEIDMDPDAVPVRYDGSPDDCEEAGKATFYFPSQMFPKEGIFKGFIGVKDDRDGSKNPQISGVTIWFKVLPGIAQMGHACDAYVDELDKALQNFKVKLDQHDKDYQTQLQQVIDDARNTFENETKATHDGLVAAQQEIHTNRSEQEKLFSELNLIEGQIDQNDIVRKVEFKASSEALQKSINDQLSKINTNPEGFDNLDALKAKYPQGQPGLFFTADDKHLHIYTDNRWKDVGSMPLTGLTNEQQQIIANAVYNGIFIYSKELLKAPYTDLNLYPANTIVTVGVNSSSILHLPKKIFGQDFNSGFTVLTYGPSETSHGKSGDGAIQIFMTQQGKLAWRIHWSGVYTEWMSDNSNAIFIYSKDLLHPPYTDLDIYPVGTTVTVATDSSTIQHMPTNLGADFNSGFTVYTYGPHDINTGVGNDGATQILVTQNGYIAWRIHWNGHFTQWSSRNSLDRKFFYSKDLVKKPYDDLDTFPTNTSAVYATNGAEVKNKPVDGGFAIKTWGLDGNNGQSGAMQLVATSTGDFYVRRAWGNPVKFSDWGQIKAETTEDKEFEIAKPSLSMFGRFGVIGDSYASGVLEDFKHKNKDIFATMTPEMTENLSWPTMLARKWGTSMLHLAKGGLSTRTWLTDDQGLKKMNESDPQDIYYLCLGINDFYGLGASYLGSEGDMDSGADTFYGNYAKIIKSIQTKAPLAKIIMFGVTSNPSDSTDIRNQFSNAQQKIAKHFDIAYISQNDDKLFNSTYFSQNMGSGHPSSYLYGALANAYERLIQKAVYRNKDYFYDYGWNGEFN